MVTNHLARHGGALQASRLMSRLTCLGVAVWALLFLLARPALASRTGDREAATPPTAGASVAPEEWWAPYTGGSHSVTVSVGSAEAWVALSSVPWLTLSANGGQGPGLLTVTALPNHSMSTRSGVVTVAGRTVGVTQVAVAECGGPLLCEGVPVDVAVDPAREQVFSLVVPAGVASLDLRIDGNRYLLFNMADPLDAGCGIETGWLAIFRCTVSQPVAGTYRVRIRVPPDYHTTSYGVTLRASFTTRITTLGPYRSEVINEYAQQIKLRTNQTFPVEVSGVPSWMTLQTTPEIDGSGTRMMVTATRNQETIPRLATLTISGERWHIKQAGRTEKTTVTPSAWTPDAGGDSRRIAVSAARPTAAWSASSSADWLTVTDSPGIGPGAATITAAANPGPRPRTAMVHVDGESITVRQPVRGQPVNVSTVVRGRTVTLRWQWPATTGMVPTDYVVKGVRSPEGEAFVSMRTGSDTPAVTFTVPDALGPRLYLRIAAMVGDVEMIDSDPVLVILSPQWGFRGSIFYECDTCAPSSPRNLLGHAIQDGVIFSWDAPTDGSTISETSLIVSGPPQGTEGSPLSGRFAVGPSGYVDVRGLAPGTYTIQVQNVNGFYWSEPSNQLVLTLPGGCPVPAVPEGVQAYAVGRLVTLRWDAPAGGAAPLGYVVTVGGSLTLSSAVAGREVITMAPPGTYTISVAATNACGTGEASRPVSLTVP